MEGTFRIAYKPGMTSEGDSLAESRDAMRHQRVPWLSQSGHKRGYVDYMALATSHLTKMRRGTLFGDAIMEVTWWALIGELEAMYLHNTF